MSKIYQLSTKNLSVGYGKKVVLENVTLSVEKGRILTLIGPNGGGKSTLLKSISAQLRTMGGTVYIGKEELGSLSSKELSRRMSLVLTQRIQPELMTCFDVVASGRYPYTGRMGFLTEHDKGIIHRSLDYVHASELAERDFNCISDGQRQRVMLARALCQEPEIIVLDEPTSFLDIRHKLELLNLLKKLTLETGLTVIMSLHELDLAQKISDVVVCVHETGIQRVGAPEEVFTKDYIPTLYGVTEGVYEPLFGSVELPRAEGKPKVFVIGGGGGGIPVYRELNRRGIPFAAGVLHENDVEYPVAKALSVKVVTETAFEPVSEETIAEAKAVMAGCQEVICAVSRFGMMNERVKELVEMHNALRECTMHN